jgi:ATP-dependent Lhr-like helicase
MSASAFELLHPLLQQELYRMRWTQLRPIQVEAIREILQGDRHLLISAATAGGKTEAAFLPILSRMVDDRQGGIRALYVGPLKALINDQFRRLEELCERAQIPVHRWHGDVGQSRKRMLLADPAGVLLITPESIESLFVNHPAQLPALFSRLAFAVIDELHSFIGTERGAHLKSLLSRVTAKSSAPVRLVALSATMGDLPAAAQWLTGESAADDTRVIQGDGDKTIQYVLKGYLRALPPSLAPAKAKAEEVETEADRLLAGEILRAFHGRTGLIFANSRRMLEFYADLVRRMCGERRLPDCFRVHHGSLSKAEREETEEALRSDRPTATFCSSTLELGIDVGNIELIGQIGAPWSVSSLTQRLGRSGRHEEQASVMRLFIQDDELTEKTGLVDRLFPELLQAIAMTELMLERWCEPPEADRLHLSTLVQQIMSVIAEYGGARADRLYDVLVTHGAFANIDRDTLVRVLRSMGASDLIEQTAEGALILGLQGEHIVRSFDFYSAFVTMKEMRVVHSGKLIGTISAMPGLAADGYLILAGRRWHVLEVDERGDEIIVEPSRGGRVPYFKGASGADIRPEVRRRMRELLSSDNLPRYLDPRAREMLSTARMTAHDVGLTDRPFVHDGANTIWFTWTGSRINRTMMALATFIAGMKVTDDGVALTFEGTTEDAVREAYRRVLTAYPSAEELAAKFPVKVQEKYDWCLSEELQARALGRNALDLEGALMLIREQMSPAYGIR